MGLGCVSGEEVTGVSVCVCVCVHATSVHRRDRPREQGLRIRPQSTDPGEGQEELLGGGGGS